VPIAHRVLAGVLIEPVLTAVNFDDHAVPQAAKSRMNPSRGTCLRKWKPRERHVRKCTQSFTSCRVIDLRSERAFSLAIGPHPTGCAGHPPLKGRDGAGV
jgi:hypothetical protein